MRHLGPTFFVSAYELTASHWCTSIPHVAGGYCDIGGTRPSEGVLLPGQFVVPDEVGARLSCRRMRRTLVLRASIEP